MKALASLPIEKIQEASAQCESEDFMLTLEDAQTIVHGSVGKMANRSLVRHEDTLSGLGIISAPDFQILADRIVADLSSMSAKIEPGHLTALAASATVAALIHTVQISARKLCSNPNDPHPQPCCPYPEKCGVCLFPVL